MSYGDVKKQVDLIASFYSLELMERPFNQARTKVIIDLRGSVLYHVRWLQPYAEVAAFSTTRRQLSDRENQVYLELVTIFDRCRPLPPY
jgi:CMP-2-keto-3-deoxyoctulosonic acid synthetase